MPPLVQAFSHFKMKIWIRTLYGIASRREVLEVRRFVLQSSHWEDCVFVIGADQILCTQNDQNWEDLSPEFLSFGVCSGDFNFTASALLNFPPSKAFYFDFCPISCFFLPRLPQSKAHTVIRPGIILWGPRRNLSETVILPLACLGCLFHCCKLLWTLSWNNVVHWVL